MILDANSPIPLHAQLEAILRRNIKDGTWPEDAKIPSENELSQSCGISRMTARTVVSKLVQEGLLYRVQGKGTFVSPRKIISRPLSQMGIRQQLDQKGYASATKLISAEKLPADSYAAGLLRLEMGDPIFRLCRVRSVKGIPLSLHTSLIPAAVCPDLLDRGFPFEEVQLCEILEQSYGIDPKCMTETLEISLAAKEQMELLNVPENYPLIHLENTVYGKDGRPAEFSSVLFRGDRIKIEIQNVYGDQEMRGN